MFTYNDLAIRPLDSVDLEWLRNLRNDESTWINLGDVLMVSDIKQQEWFKSFLQDKSKMYFVIQFKEQQIGVIRFTQIDYINHSICVGADITPEYRGRGFGKQTYDLILTYCFNVLNMHRVWLCVLSSNEKGIHIYQNKGFKIEGKMRDAIFRNGSYCDYIVMSILKDEYGETL